MKMPSLPLQQARPHTSAFTLVEVLVVVAIVAILAGLLLPALNSFQERGKSVQCLSNLRQLHVAIMAMANEDGGKLPLAGDAANNSASWGWYLLDGGYLPPLPIAASAKKARKHPLFDPGSKVVTTSYVIGSYGMNRNLAGASTKIEQITPRSNTASIANPGQKFLLLCSGIYMLTRNQAATAVPPSQYLPGRSANQSTAWPEDRQRDAVEGRHARKIHTLSLAGNVESWDADDVPFTSDRWDK